MFEPHPTFCVEKHSARKRAFNHGVPTATRRGEAQDVADYHHPPLMIMRPSPFSKWCSKNRRWSCFCGAFPSWCHRNKADLPTTLVPGVRIPRTCSVEHPFKINVAKFAQCFFEKTPYLTFCLQLPYRK